MLSAWELQTRNKWLVCITFLTPLKPLVHGKEKKEEMQLDN